MEHKQQSSTVDRLIAHFLAGAESWRARIWNAIGSPLLLVIICFVLSAGAARAQIIVPPSGKFADTVFYPDPWPSAYYNYDSVFNIGPGGRSNLDYLPRWILGNGNVPRSDISFRFSLPNNGAFTFHIDRFSQDLNIAVFVDGAVQGSVTAAGSADYSTLNEEFAVYVPAGTHTVKLINESKGDFEADWYRVPQLRGDIVHYSVTPVQRVRITINDWAQANSPATGWQVFAGAASPDLSQAQMAVAMSVDGHPEFDWAPSAQFSPVGEWVPLITVPTASGSLVNSISSTLVYTATLAKCDIVPGAPTIPPTPLTSAELSLYTGADSIFDYNDPGFQSWMNAKGLWKQSGENLLEFAFRVLTVMTTYFTYTPTAWTAVSSTVQIQQGGCGALSAVFGSVMRANKVPARVIAGRSINVDTTDDTVYFHGKAQIYDEVLGWLYVECADPIVNQSVYNNVGSTRGDFMGMVHGGVYFGSWPYGGQNASLLPTGQDWPISSTSSATVQRLDLIDPDVSSLSISPNSLTGGSTTQGSVTLEMNALPEGSNVILSSDSAVVSVPSTVLILPGTNRGQFTISTASVSVNTIAHITASSGLTSVSSSVTVSPVQISSLNINPTSVVGGSASVGSVTVSAAAGSAGVSVSLASSSAAAQVPSTVLVPSGSSSASFSVKTTGVATTTTASVTAQFGASSKTAQLTIRAATLQSLTATPSPIVGGNKGTGTVTSNGPAPTGGLAVLLTASASSLTVPTSVTILAGSTSASFSFTTAPVSATTTVTVSGKLQTGASKTASVTVMPVVVKSVSLSSASVVGGSNSSLTGTVALNGPAPVGGAIITLTSTNTKLATVPATITVAASSTTATFNVTHLMVSSVGSVVIKATSGGQSASASLSVSPFQVKSLSVTPASVPGGTASTGSVSLNATLGAKTGSVTVKLASSSKSATAPFTVSISAGTSSAGFKISTVPVSANTAATVTGTLGASSQSTNLTVLPPSLSALSVSPTTVKGSSTTVVTGTVTISSIAPSGGMVIGLKSSNIAAAGTPATVTILAGKTSATFTVSHKKVSTQVSVTISGTALGKTQSATLALTQG